MKRYPEGDLIYSYIYEQPMGLPWTAIEFQLYRGQELGQEMVITFYMEDTQGRYLSSHLIRLNRGSAEGINALIDDCKPDIAPKVITEKHEEES